MSWRPVELFLETCRAREGSEELGPVSRSVWSARPSAVDRRRSLCLAVYLSNKVGNSLFR